MCGRAARWWDEQIEDIIQTELTKDVKCIGRLLMVERICGMSVVDYLRR